MSSVTCGWAKSPGPGSPVTRQRWPDWSLYCWSGWIRVTAVGGPSNALLASMTSSYRRELGTDRGAATCAPLMTRLHERSGTAINQHDCPFGSLRRAAPSVTTKTARRRFPAWGPLVLWGGAAAGVIGLAIYCAASGSEKYVETGDTYPGLFISFAATAGYFLAAICGSCVVGGECSFCSVRVPTRPETSTHPYIVRIFSCSARRSPGR